MTKFKNLFISLFLFFSLISFCCGQNEHQNHHFLGKGLYEGEYWPTQQWKSCRPEDVGMQSSKLIDVYFYLANPAINTEGIVIIKNGHIVGEAYFGNFTINSRHESFSIAKSFLSALVGIALEKGLIKDVEEKIYLYYPQLSRKKTFWRRSKGGIEEIYPQSGIYPVQVLPGAKKRITIKHLLTMTSGFEWNERDYYEDTSQNDVFKMAAEYDFIQYVLNKPIVYEPGTEWCYSSGDSMLLSGIIEKSANTGAYDFGMEHLFMPIGISGIEWHNDPAGHTIGGWGIQATVREFAKFGYLYLKKGKWEDQQIVPDSWIKESLQPVSPEVNYYGYQWWLLPALSGYAESVIPPKTFLAWGIFTQQIFVIPEEDLVIVRVADDPGSEEWDEVEFLELVLDSILLKSSQR
jgi:CubicO group peptidase (beta-lactamase class C family)